MTVRDGRRPPFAYQELVATAIIRLAFEGQKRMAALAIYQTMTEVANEARARVNGDSPFEAERKRLADLAGCSPDTIDRYTTRFIELGLLDVERRRQGSLNLPNLYTLLTPEPPPDGGGRTPAATPGTAAPTPGGEGGTPAGGGRTDAATGRAGAATGSRTGAAQGGRTGAAQVTKKEEPPTVDARTPSPPQAGATLPVRRGTRASGTNPRALAANGAPPNEHARDAFDLLVGVLEEAAGDDFDLWLADLELTGVDGTHLVVDVPPAKRAIVEQRFGRLVQSCAGSVGANVRWRTRTGVAA